MLDGPAARLTHSESDKGAALDSAADILFFAVCAVKLLPVMSIPSWALIWTALIAAVKLINIITGIVRFGRPVLPHTAANKCAGVMLFLFPLTAVSAGMAVSSAAVCAVSSFAAVQEGLYIRKYREEK